MNYPTLKEVLESYSKGPRAVTEASLSRVMGQARAAQAGQGSFGIVTSWLDSRTNEGNDAAWAAFLGDLKKGGFGYRKLIGHWAKCSDDTIPYTDCKPPNKVIVTTEPSAFITGITKAQVETLGRRYDQWGWIYAGPESDNRVIMYDINGDATDLGKWQPGALEKAYSQLYRRKHNKVFKNLSVQGSAPAFTFTEKPGRATEEGCERKLRFIELTAQSFMEGCVFAKYESLRQHLLNEGV